MAKVKRTALEVEFIARVVTKPVKMLALVAFEGDSCRPRAVVTVISAVSVVKGKLLLFFKERILVFAEGQLAVSFKLNTEVAR